MTRHKVFDLPCSEGSAFADVKQILDWSGNVPSTLESTDPLYVEERFLESLASAVGTNSADYYQEVPESPEVPTRRVQVTSKLMELALANVRQDLLSCGDVGPTPRPRDNRDPWNPDGPRPWR